MKRRTFTALVGGAASLVLIRQAPAMPPATIVDGAPIGRGNFWW